ncbi:MAG TPA: TrmB family transcriptional regulator [Oceanospirillales bacterium]|nr:TrmB family transcriptional regulator [Oceanospirillales bacterium]
MILGELEKQVLNHLWSAGEADAKQIHAAFSAGRSSSLNTIQSTLDRLYKKQLLSRSKQGHAFAYRTRVDREDLIAQLIRNITSDLVSHDSQSLMAAFVSLSADLGDDELDRLEAMIQNHRRKSKLQP